MEVCVFSAFLAGYLCSEQFWLELIAVVSLVPLSSVLVVHCEVLLSDCACTPWVLTLAQTAKLIFYPIRAAAMSHRVAKAGLALLTYARDLAENVIEGVVTPKADRKGLGRPASWPNNNNGALFIIAD